MEIIKKIHRLTDLPELSSPKGSKLIIAYDRKNYMIDASLIAGKKISGITEHASNESGGRNLIIINFSDGTSKQLYVYNGSAGKPGHEGLVGDKGKTGQNASVDISKIRDAKDVLTIVNDYVSNPNDNVHDETCEDAWSAFRGKYANDELIKLNETFITDAEYDILWNEDVISYIEAEYTTTEENKETIIFANDTNAHKVFKKFWTYEEGDIATYYVAIYGILTYVDDEGVEHQQLDEHGDPKIGIVRYDPVVANLWDDIYLGDTEGYFPATNNQLDDLSQLYVYDSKTNEYVEITIDRDQTVTKEGSEQPVANDNYKDKDFEFYSEGMKEYLHTHFTNATTTWTYSFDHGTEFKKPIYKEDTAHPHTSTNEDGETVTTYDIIAVGANEQLQAGVQYYYAADKNATISDIDTYLNFSEQRCWIKTWNEDETAYTWVEQEYITKYETEEDRQAYLETLKEANKEFMTLVIDRVDQSYTFTRFYPEKVKRDIVYREKQEVYKNGNQPVLYAHFDSREYYTSKITSQTNSETNELEFITEYTKIIVPDWIIAEFTTTYEDENAIVLNSIAEIGTEDNTVIDITAEDYEDDDNVEIIPVKFVACNEMEKFYEKNTYGEYDEVSFDNVNLSRVAPYYKLIGEWIDLTYEEAMNEPADTELYYYNEYGERIMNTAAPVEDKTYCKWVYNAEAIVDENGMNNIADFIKHQNITIFTGIPKQLHFTFIPNDATYKFAKIEYDSDIVTLLEDGRICAIGEQLDENNETHTQIVITPIDIETEKQTGNELVLDITILTPMTKVIIEKDNETVTTTEVKPLYMNRQVVVETSEDGEDDEEPIEEPIDEKIDLDYIVAPLTTSNKKLNFSISNDSVINIDKTTEKLNENTTTIKLVGLKAGKVLLNAEAKDGFGASAQCWIEVVEPVTDVKWDMSNGEDAPKIEMVYYTDADVNNYMLEHGVDEPVPFKKGDLKEITMTILKDVEYEYMPLVTPSNASYPELQWTSTHENIVKVTNSHKTIEDEPEVIATQEDVDNGLATEVGEKISEAVTHDELIYIIKGSKITTSEGYVYDNDGNPTTEKVKISGKLKNVYGALAQDEANKHQIDAYVIVNQSVESIIINLIEAATIVENIKAYALNVGTSKQLSATLEPENAVRTFVWESGDSSIVTVNENGIINAVKPGITKIYAKATDGSKKVATCDITVTVPVTDINLYSDDENASVNGIIYIGLDKTATIKAQIFYNANAGGTDETKFGVDWTSSDTTIATTSESANNDECIVTGKKLGATTILATAKDKSGTLGAIQVVVIKMNESIEFETNEYVLDVNDSLSLMPKFTPADSSNQVLVWTSSDETKATVNNSGIVTAIASTDKDDEDRDIPVVITATTTDGSNISATCNIKIN